MSTICEIYPCIQGEGSRAGTPSILIRTTGCNLRCSWCDTPYTSWNPEKGNLTLSNITEALEANPLIDEVILSGGEPTLSPALSDIIRICRERDKKITLETNGTRRIDRNLMEAIDLVSLSPKLSNSTPWDSPAAARHEQERIQTDILRDWMSTAVNYQFKFVVAQPSDIEEIQTLLRSLGADRKKIFLMPEGRTEEELRQRREWLAGECIREAFCYGERLHIVIYGDKRGV